MQLSAPHPPPAHASSQAHVETERALQRRDLPQLLHFQRKTAAVRRGGIIQGRRKKGAFQQSPPGRLGGRGQAGGGSARRWVRADASTGRFFQGCQVDFLSAPCADTCGLLHDTSLYFCNLWCPSSPPGNHCVAMINDTQAVYYTH